MKIRTPKGVKWGIIFCKEISSLLVYICINKHKKLYCFRMPNEIPTLDFNDTFLDMEHLRNSFPGYEIKVQTDDPRKLVRPFK